MQWLHQLPGFRVLRFENASAEGVYDSGLRIGEGWIGYLISDERTFSYGRFFGYDPTTFRAVFRPDAKEPGAELRLATYHYADGYWGERIELVFDKHSHWTRAKFETRGKRDHEHCSICWATLSETERPFGYVDQRNRWVCEECFLNSIEPRTPAFIDANALAQIRGHSDA